MRRSRAIVALIALAAALLAAPTGVVAAEPGTVTVTGNVTREGAGVAGANVVVSVTGRDQAVAAVTDDAGDFTADIEASVGDGIVVFASGQTSRSEPDAQGCVHTETPTGSTTTTLDEVPPAPVEVVLDTVLTDTVCTPTPSPKPTPGATHRPRASSAPRAGVTPPTTDATGSGTGTTAGSGMAIVLAVLALTAAGLLARTRRRARS